ncbi:MAG TPA: ABC transporter permease subunit [Hypericibacter adhaerens]|jgi:NitT/TauT family transport system permease protein|uniref:ABC transporter permease n=1 Tax=Hypericibacter adhaerens TaxID=2602016 RepID=UPI002B94C9B4|nr:ABC transporter permease subunit [Hypericibacter adhaerens]HWA42102.1 ABC transporter permease subunit [Hypericibacter adhaerens]
MSEATADKPWGGASTLNAASRASARQGGTWWLGAVAGLAWLLAAGVTVAWPDLHDWESTHQVAIAETAVGAWLLLLGALSPWLPLPGRRLRYWGPWLLALGLGFALWQVATAKFGWLPRPFFAPPQGIVDVFIEDWPRLLECVWRSLFLWGTGYFFGVTIGFLLGTAIGWSRLAAYWIQPVLKLIGPVPANAWIPIVFFVFPTTFSGSVFLIALASGIPVTILTWSGIASVGNAYYDVARTLGASNRFLILKVAVPAAMPHVFVGLFMGLYSSFAVLVVAELLGVKAGLGWYIQWATGWAAYANVHATLIIMALLCSGLVKLLFLVRDRTLSWQRGVVRW